MEYTSVKDLREKVFKLRRELKEDISSIKSYQRNTSNILDSSAVQNYNKWEKKLKRKQRTITSMDEDELKSTYRELLYIRNLKSSTLEGALESAETIGNLKDYLSELNDDTQEAFWEAYKDIYHHGKIIDKFKYEIWENMKYAFNSSEVDAKTVANAIEKLFHEESLKGQFTTEGEFQTSFTENLTTLFEAERGLSITDKLRRYLEESD